MSIKSFFTLTISLSSFIVFSQNGNVTIHKDARLDQRIADYGMVTPSNNSSQIEGYRIQLSFDQSKENIERDRIKFSTQFPDIPTYVIYKAPNFFLKAGDFRTSIEAKKILSKVEKDYPTSSVKREMINLPPIPAGK